jgi:hypothetical protein
MSRLATLLVAFCFLPVLLVGCGGGQQNANGVVGNGPPLSIPQGQSLTASVNSACPNGGVVTTQTLIAWGGAPSSGYTWSVTPGSTFPVGTTVDPLTGIFHGNGSGLTAGNYNLNMTVSDGSTTATGTIPLAVSTDTSGVCATTVFEQSHQPNFSLLDATAASGYGASLYADGDGVTPWTWSLATGALPPGLVIDQARGVVRGTPTSSASGQTYSFTINVVDSTKPVANVATCPCANYMITVH